MYESFFGLRREPFSIAPDPRFLYLSEKHREALAHLMYGLRSGGGFVLLTGEIGAGKTTVWRSFLEQLPTDFDVAYVVNPKLGVEALLKRVCEDLRVEVPPGGIVDPIDAIHGHLLLAHAGGRRALIVVDEAQALSIEVFEQLRLLTNLVTADRKLMQVLLIGQPELRTMIEQPVLEPLAQRVVARFHLPALSEAETARYVAHRLTIAGLDGPMPFDAAALAHIHQLCGGVPRRINVLCDRAMLHAHASGQHRVDRLIIDHAAGEVFARTPPTAMALPNAAPVTAETATRAAPTVAPARARPLWPAWAGLAAGALALGVVLAQRLGPAADAPGARPGAPAAGPTASGPTAAARAPAATAPAPLVTAATPMPTQGAGPGVASAAAASAQGMMASASNGVATGTANSPPAPASPGAAASAAPGAPPRVAVAALFGAAGAGEAAAWRTLAGFWGVTLGPGEPCVAAARQALACYRSRGGLGPIRQLDRPGIVTLTDERAGVAHVLLTGLSADSARLRVGGNDVLVPLVQLAQVWRGEFATLWRVPPGYRDGELVDPAGPLGPWLGERLALLDGAPATAIGADALRNRTFAFQLARGLQPDGLTGPLTLMQISRASGINEPRLQNAP